MSFKWKRTITSSMTTGGTRRCCFLVISHSEHSSIMKSMDWLHEHQWWTAEKSPVCVTSSVWFCSVHLKGFFRVLLCCFYPEFFDAFALRFGYFAAFCSNQRIKYSLNQHILGGEDHVTHVDGQQYHNIYVQIWLVLAHTQTGTE